KTREAGRLGQPQALAVALSFCRLLGLGCPKQAFAKIATPFVYCKLSFTIDATNKDQDCTDVQLVNCMAVSADTGHGHGFSRMRNQFLTSNIAAKSYIEGRSDDFEVKEVASVITFTLPEPCTA
ncbi:hypothetical protein, partial [Methyloglobulus sp.]|uniref:hypothetical protein n=1 Tax=Methyloglobulus sp. TaxID=2518622 RepID=UPI003989DD56